MDSDEISSYFKAFGKKVYTKFKGCFASDNLPLIVESNNFYFINTQDTKESQKKFGNGHWTVLFGGSPQEKKDYAIFFDPFGRICDNYDLIQKVLKDHTYIMYNNICIQSILSNFCGFHCVLVSLFWCHGFSFESILQSIYDLKTSHEMTNDMRALKLITNLTPADL